MSSRSYLDGSDGLKQEIDRIAESLGIKVITTIEKVIFISGGVDGEAVPEEGIHVVLDGAGAIIRRPGGKFAPFELLRRKNGFTRVRRHDGTRYESDGDLRFPVAHLLQRLIYRRASMLSREKLPTVAESDYGGLVGMS